MLSIRPTTELAPDAWLPRQKPRCPTGTTAQDCVDVVVSTDWSRDLNGSRCSGNCCRECKLREGRFGADRGLNFALGGLWSHHEGRVLDNAGTGQHLDTAHTLGWTADELAKGIGGAALDDFNS